MEGQNVKKRAFGKAAISKINAAAIKIWSNTGIKIQFKGATQITK